MNQRGRVINYSKSNYTPNPEQVLFTNVCRDICFDKHYYEEAPSALTRDGYQDGFGEYTTHIPEEYKFHTKQPDYGLRFLEANVIGPKYLHYPEHATLIKELESGNYTVL